ncbi:uncharacterized protein ColSpa_06125 [Colletotrichum spaethianum]|uniref:Uncharacterized protein n=1 Tax=Colletotrichum spaethianum TaxID=700344 RepID=A0AA37LGI1_9PEZI|nr:uncharacterized protein ColSpa_06125 [Colletotrichum spaethianum]GKT45944.1 hypothetical protein ColSpa_06125 [Colletotrichum spaethianum]
MAGDGRKKGGVYSDNPNTKRTRDFLRRLPPNRKEARRRGSLEYRAFRTTCITRSKKADYHKATRNGKLAMLREACHKSLANRLKRGVEYVGTDIEIFIARFHDRVIKQNADADAGASDDADTSGPASEACDLESDNEQPATVPIGDPSTASASLSDTANLADFIDYDQGVADEFSKYVEQLEEKQEMILQELSVRSYTQFETANSLGLLLEAAGF